MFVVSYVIVVCCYDVCCLQVGGGVHSESGPPREGWGAGGGRFAPANACVLSV